MTLPSNSRSPDWLIRWLALFSLPALALAIVALWIADVQTSYTQPALFWFFHVGMVFIGIGLIVIPAMRGFLANGQPSVLMIGCGYFMSLLGALGMKIAGDLDKGFATYNTAVLLSGVCHLLGVVLTARHPTRLPRPGLWLLAVFGTGTALMGVVLWAALAGRMPVFFIPGTGSTLVRVVVVLAGAGLLGLTAGLLWRANRRTPAPFLFWYALGLGLLAVGLTGSLLIMVKDSPLQWLTRTTQVLGTFYMSAAVWLGGRNGGRRNPLAAVEEAWRTKGWLLSLWRQAPVSRLARYVGAVLVVAAGFGLRLAITAWIGPGLPTYITFYPAVMLAALLGGVGPGLLATATASFVAGYWILPPVGQWAIATTVDRTGLMLFAGMGVFMSIIAELYRRKRQQVTEFERAAAERVAAEALRRQAELIDPIRAELIAAEMLRTVRNRDRTEPAAVPDWLARVPTVAGVVVAFTGAVVLVGWLFDVTALKSVLPGLVTMKANTALGLLLAGVALAGRDRRWLRLVCAAGVCVLAGLTLAEFAAGWDLGIDQWLFRELPDAPTVSPGRMSIGTGWCFALSGAALLLLKLRRIRWVTPTLAALAGSLGAMGLLGYIFGAQSLYHFGSTSSMALHTAVAFVVLATGLLLARPDGLTHLLSTASPGNQFVRRYVPVIVLMTILIGLLHRRIEQTGILTQPTGDAIFVLAMLVAALTVAWWIAHALNHADATRRETETQLRHQSELMNHAGEALIVRELGGAIRFWNQGAATLYGWSAAEAIGQRTNILLHTEGVPVAEKDRQLAQTGHWEGELTHTARDGRRIVVESRQTATRGADGQIMVLESDRDITARKAAELELHTARNAALNLMDDAVAARRQTEQANAALQASEQRIQQALNVSHSFTFEWQPATDAVLRSDSIATILRLTGAAVCNDTGQNYFKSIHPDDRARFTQTLKDLTPAADSYTTEYRVVCGDGTVVVLEETGHATFNAAGKLERLVGVSTDITARKQAEDALAVSEQQARERAEELAVVLEAVPVAVFIAHDSDCRHLTGNRLADAILRIPHGDELSLSAAAATKPHHFKVFQNGRELRLDELPAQRSARGEHVNDFEMTLVFDDGVVRHVLGYGTPLFDAQGQPRGTVAALVDITDRKQAVDALAASETRYRSLFQNLQEGFYLAEAIFDDHGQCCDAVYLDVNPAFEQIMSRRREQIIGHRVKELVPEIKPQWLAVFGQVTQTGVAISHESYSDVFQKHFEAFVFRPEPGRFGVLVQDVTARKQAEADLRVREEQLRLFAEHAPASIAMFDTQMRYIAASQHWLADFGFAGQDLRGRCHYDVFPEIPDRWRAIHRRCLDGAIERCDEDPFVRADGTTQWLRWEIRPWHTVAGAVGGIVIFSEDITARKQAEVQLRLQTSALQAADNAIAIIDRNGVIQWINAAFTRLTGYSATEVIGQNPRVLKSGQHPVEFYAGMWATIIAGRVWHGELINKRKDGQLYTEEMTVTPVTAPDGTITHFIAIKQDITARKQAELALRLSEERLQFALTTIQTGAWELDLVDHTAYRSLEHDRVFGYTELLPAWTYEMFLEHVLPDDRTMVDGKFQHAIKTHGDWNLECRIHRADGAERWILAAGRHCPDAAGVVRRMAGIVQDITDRKQAEAQIKAALTEKEVLLKEIHHRVKNNLQVISSLVSLQADDMTDPRLLEVFGDVRDRVRAMALVHESLYQTGDLARLNLADYATSLMNHLWSAHRAVAGKVQLKLAIAPVILPVDLAVPCGLILNELASNALKHAFPGGRSGEVTVTVEHDPKADTVCLCVRDNGIGLPANRDWQQSKSLGVRLVHMLAHQLRGTVTIGPGPGAEFRVTFPINNGAS